jgi:hypothetical protein
VQDPSLLCIGAALKKFSARTKKVIATPGARTGLYVERVDTPPQCYPHGGQPQANSMQPYLCPCVDDWSATTPLRDGDEILTSKQTVTIVFDYGLPSITLPSPRGFTRRMIVAEICSTLQKAEFRSGDRFLERIERDNGLVAFRLGS